MNILEALFNMISRTIISGLSAGAYFAIYPDESFKFYLCIVIITFWSATPWIKYIYFGVGKNDK